MGFLRLGSLTSRLATPLARIGSLLLCMFAAGPANAQDSSSVANIAMIPERLTNGAPFLLTVKLPSRAAALQGTFTGRPILFFQSKPEGGKAGGADTWYALAGVDVETEPGTYPLAVEATTADGKILKMSRPIEVSAASYRIGVLRVPENFVAPDAATQKEIAEDKEIKDRIFARSAPAPEWSGDFVKPVRAPSTDSFGTRRTFNGKLASIHRGMDFRAPAGTPVAAANSGKVVLAKHLFYEGNCVVIDHGEGFMTIYMHLSRFEVAEGETVVKGQRLGLSGATGRVTGPHLHFAARWQGAYVDPAGLFALPLAERP